MAEKKKSTQQKDKITFHYIKADNFHSILSTGVIGGITVNSLIDMNFFTDRVTIPQQLTFEVDKNGVILNECHRETKEGAVREVHFGALINLETAKSLIKWLNEKIDILEQNQIVEQ